MDNRTGLFTNAVIWFGVAISVSEIEAGISIGNATPAASMWTALILGHILGGILLFLVGYIGANIRMNAMEMTEYTFSRLGSKFFATLNVMQLVAWVAVLNAQGAMAINSLNLPISFPLICIILAVFIAIYVYVGLERISKITTIIMIILTILLAILSIRLWGINPGNISSITSIPKASNLGFWNIFEISIAMPISWLPVISDYTKDVEKPFMATFLSAAAYTIASLWMYFIGIEIAHIGAGVTIAQAILLANLGISGIIIVVLSTITTNFLAANSAGQSANVIYNKLNPKKAGIIVSIFSALLAISGIMNYYINFLYLIASVFAPMAAVLLVSNYLTDNMSNINIRVWVWNMFSWLAGFVVYNITISLDSIILGPTLLAIIVSATLAIIGILSERYLWFM